MSRATARVIRGVHRQGTLGHSDEWETPADVFAAWNARFNFTLDVAASPANAKCQLYLTEKQDALSVPWGRHRCWMNPPYSRGNLALWTQKAKQEAFDGALVCGLLPVSTDRKWWRENIWEPQGMGVPMGFGWDYETQSIVRQWAHLQVSVHFIPRRLSFLHEGKAVDRARAPSAIVVWEPWGGYLEP